MGEIIIRGPASRCSTRTFLHVSGRRRKKPYKTKGPEALDAPGLWYPRSLYDLWHRSIEPGDSTGAGAKAPTTTTRHAASLEDHLNPLINRFRTEMSTTNAKSPISHHGPRWIDARDLDGIVAGI
jgi:hypothetical protein